MPEEEVPPLLSPEARERIIEQREHDVAVDIDRRAVRHEFALVRKAVPTSAARTDPHTQPRIPMPNAINREIRCMLSAPNGVIQKYWSLS